MSSAERCLRDASETGKADDPHTEEMSHLDDMREHRAHTWFTISVLTAGLSPNAERPSGLSPDAVGPVSYTHLTLPTSTTV